jgi:hypothetical protein
VYATDGALIENLDLERASRGAIMRAGGGADPNGLRQRADRLIHGARRA